MIYYKYYLSSEPEKPNQRTEVVGNKHVFVIRCEITFTFYDIKCLLPGDYGFKKLLMRLIVNVINGNVLSNHLLK